MGIISFVMLRNSGSLCLIVLFSSPICTQVLLRWEEAAPRVDQIFQQE
jgi:hypothetical protein